MGGDLWSIQRSRCLTTSPTRRGHQVARILVLLVAPILVQGWKFQPQCVVYGWSNTGIPAVRRRRSSYAPALTLTANGYLRHLGMGCKGLATIRGVLWRYLVKTIFCS